MRRKKKRGEFGCYVIDGRTPIAETCNKKCDIFWECLIKGKALLYNEQWANVNSLMNDVESLLIQKAIFV